MKLLRHILSHLFLIIFFMAIVSVFYYRTLLLPTDVVRNIDGVVKDVYPPALNFVSKRDYFWSIKGERIVSFDDLNIFENNNSVPVEAEKKELVVAENRNVNDEVDAKSVKSDLVKLELAKETGQAKNKLDMETTPAVVTEEKSSLPDNNVNKIPVTTNSKNNKDGVLAVVIKERDTSSESELLINARDAFHKGAITQSENFYLELIQRDNKNPDTYGELGNVYYSQGKWDEAGQAYYEAAMRLIADGKYNQVTYLQRVITGLNTEYAEKLSHHMMR